MPSLTKQQVKMIVTAFENQSGRVKVTPTWEKLVQEYSLGQVRGNYIEFSRQDYKAWREILIAECGYDPTKQELTGSRTEVASLTPNEKWSTESLSASMVSATAIGGQLMTAKGQCEIIPEVEYRVSVNDVLLSDYDAVLVVENYEAFIFVHRFQVPDIGHCLVLYRGHDTSAQRVIELLSGAVDMPVIGFTDPDPAGVGILHDNKYYNHALIPELRSLAAAPSLTSRFAKQLAARPRLKEQCAARSEAFRHYVNLVVDKGRAVSQEWLCSHEVPLELISL